MWKKLAVGCMHDSYVLVSPFALRGWLYAPLVDGSLTPASSIHV